MDALDLLKEHEETMNMDGERRWAVVRIPAEFVDTTDESKGITLQRGLTYEEAVQFKAQLFRSIERDGGTIEDNYRWYLGGEVSGLVICADDLAPRDKETADYFGLAADLARERAAQREELEAEPVTPAGIISADDVIARLLALPNEIAAANVEVIRAEQSLAARKAILQSVEDQLLLERPDLVDGKNEATRAAQMRLHTKDQRRNVRDEERRLQWARHYHAVAVNVLAAYRAAARLLERG